MKKLLLVFSIMVFVSCQTMEKKRAEGVKAHPESVKRTLSSKLEKNNAKPMETEATMSLKHSICEVKNDKREIKIVKEGVTGCRVDYIKFGKTSKIADAKHDQDFCLKKYNRVLENLKAGGFRCDEKMSKSAKN